MFFCHAYRFTIVIACVSMHIVPTTNREMTTLCPGNIKIINQRKLLIAVSLENKRLFVHTYNAGLMRLNDEPLYETKFVLFKFFDI